MTMLKQKYVRYILVLIAAPALFLAASITVASQANKIQCEVKIYKSPDWANYDVNIAMYNFADQKKIASYKLPKATAKKKSVNSITKQFDCAKYQQVNFVATFSPAIWQNNESHKFVSMHVYELSKQLLEAKPDVDKLIIQIHFPQDFVGVPQLIESSTLPN